MNSNCDNCGKQEELNSPWFINDSLVSGMKLCKLCLMDFTSYGKAMVTSQEIYSKRLEALKKAREARKQKKMQEKAEVVI